MICLACKKEFTPKRKDQYSCSNSCSGKAYSIKHKKKCLESKRKWAKDNYNIQLEKIKDWRKKTGKAAEYSSKYRASKRQAIPKWANQKYIGLWYKLAKIESDRTDKCVEVDHIIPLISDKVCGLHCEDNMQLLFQEDNRRKSNRIGELG